MKKIILLFLAAFLSIPQFSKCKDDPKGFYLGLSGSPDYTYRSLNGNGFLKDYRNEIEKARLRYTIGISALLKINKRFTLESGLLYSAKGYQAKMPAWIEGDGQVVGPTMKMTFYYDYLDIPFKANLYILDKKIKVFISVGGCVNLLLTARQKVQHGDGFISKSSNSDGYNKIGISLTGSAGLEFPLSSKINFRVEPIYRRSLSKLNNYSAPIKEYLYNAGLNFGIFYKM